MSTDDKKIESLKKVMIFSSLSNDAIEGIYRKMKMERYKEGEYIIREGEHGDKMYILYKGSVQITKKLVLKVGRESFEDKDKTLVSLSADDHSFFGEMGLLVEDLRTADVHTLEDCEVFSISKKDFDEFSLSDPHSGLEILRQISRILCGRLRKSNVDMLKLTTALSIALS